MKDYGTGCPRTALASVLLTVLMLSGCAPLLSSSGIDQSGRSVFDDGRGSSTVATTDSVMISPSAANGESCFGSSMATVMPTTTRTPDMADYTEYRQGPALWDNSELIITPANTVAPVGSDVVLIAGVRGPDEYLRTNEKVHWTVCPSGVGYLTDYDKAKWTDYLVGDFTNPRKLNRTEAITSTSRDYLRLNRETPTQADDVLVKRGQTWITITSPVEGTSNVNAFAPSVYGWATRSQTATIHWIDAKFQFPSPVVVPAGGQEQLTTRVVRQTNGSALVGWAIRYTICGGGPAGFAPDGVETVEIATNGAGEATAKIFQKTAGATVNQVKIEVIRPASPDGMKPRLVVGSSTTMATFSSPELQVRKIGPTTVGTGEEFSYRITVTNPGDLPTDRVLVVDEIPAGLELLNTAPTGQKMGSQVQWDIGRLAPRESRTMEVRLRCLQPGTLTSCVEATAAGGLRARNCMTTVVGHPKVTIQCVGPPTARVGDEIRFEIIVTNAGEVTATGLLIKDRFDDGLQHAQAASPIEKDLTDLAPGQSQRIGLNFRVTRPGNLCHDVEISGSPGIRVTGQGCVSVSGSTAPETAAPNAFTPVPGSTPAIPGPAAGVDSKLRVSVKAVKPVEDDKFIDVTTVDSGGTALFLIELTNEGQAAIRNLKIVDTYDASLSPKGASKDHEHDRDRRQVSWQEPILSPGEQITFQIQGDVSGPSGAMSNRVEVTAEGGLRETSKVSVQVEAPAGSQSTSPSTTAPPSTDFNFPSSTPTNGSSGVDGLSTTPPSFGSPTLSDTTAATTAGGAKLEMTIIPHANPAKVGKSATYEVRVTNSGTGADQDLVLEVTMPPELIPSPIGTTASGPKKIDGQRVRFGPLKQIGIGETLKYLIETNVAAPGNPEIRAQLTSRSMPTPKTTQKSVELFK
jgi:uncharacterized repeat protein (TIGR01451 family)